MWLPASAKATQFEGEFFEEKVLRAGQIPLNATVNATTNATRVVTPESAAGNRMMAEALQSASSVFIVGAGRRIQTWRRGIFFASVPKRELAAGARPRHASSSSDRTQLLTERLYRDCFVIFNVEHGIEFGDLEKIVNFLRKLEQLQFAALVLGSGVGANQFADA
jgi:hypothetical protein